LGKHWGILFAANDVCEAFPIIIKAQELLNFAEGPETRTKVETAVCDAYNSRVREFAVRNYLSRYGFTTVDEFLKSGLQQFGEQIFTDMYRKIEEIDLGVFIVYGFDQITKTSHLYEIHSPGSSSNHDLTRYCAVGSGAAMAMASLTARDFDERSVPNAIYRLCEAKFCAETASGVGRSTTILVLDRAGETAPLGFGADVQVLRDIWEKTRKTPPPREAIDLIKSNLPCTFGGETS
jgi:hypothetical protein